MRDVWWLLEHSEETDASPEFVWAFWTDVGNWQDPPARFVLAGPFAPGSRGMTVLPEREPVRWTIGEVRTGRSFTTETTLEGATLHCEWQFDAIAERRTRLTQRLGLSGEKAAAQADGIRAAFEPTLSEGMRRIARQIARAAAQSAISP